MKRTIVYLLLATNLALGGTLVWRATGSTANAAQVGQTPVRGKYIMVPGEASSSSAIIYIFDAANERVGAISPDTKDTLVSMPTINLRDILDKAARDETPVNGNNRTPPGRQGNTRPPRQ